MFDSVDVYLQGQSEGSRIGDGNAGEMYREL